MRDEVVSRPLGKDEWALYDPRTDRVHALNLTAAVVWEHCDGTRTAEELAEVLVEHFPDAPRKRLVEDVLSALRRFDEEGLVTWT